MNCREFKEQIYEVAFGEAERSPSFEQHLLGCGDCRQELEVASFAASGIAAVAPPPAPSLSTDRLRTAILSDSLKAKRPWLPRLTFAGAAAGLALAAWFGFNQPGDEASPRDVVAVTDGEPLSGVEPSGPIEIPEVTPKIVVPGATVRTATAEPVRDRPARRVRRSSPSAPSTVVAAEVEYSQVPDDLLAVVVGGAEGALDSEFTAARGGSAMMETAPGAMAAPAPASSDEKPIIVIQPRGQANERSSDDVPIGG